MMSVLYIFIGIVALVLGSNYLVKGSVSLSGKLKIPSFIVGLTVISIGTSLPELFVSVSSALSGLDDIAIGNIIGSNIVNILLVLSVAMVIYPMKIDMKEYKSNFVVLLAITALFMLMLQFGNVSRLEGLVLVLCMFVYLYFCYYKSVKNKKAIKVDKEDELQTDNIFFIMLAIFGGFIALKFGADFLLKGAIMIAKAFGLSDAVIGVTIIAVGTSLPELASSAVAALRKETGLVMGNIIGSNIFNIVGVIGFSALLTPLASSDHIKVVDNWVMGLVTILFLIFSITGKKLSRFEGLLFLSMFIGYMYYQFIVL